MDEGVPPSGVVTFLFTDIEGSTRRWEADAEAMRIALTAHDEALRAAIESHDGFLFKHTGDGVCAAFSSPRSAVDAAVAAQRTLELPVRMGLATGEAELRGGDYFGVVLNRAARVMAAGHGGQILVADSTATLLSGVDMVSLGPRRLRDLATAVGIYQVRADGLRSDFPTLRAQDPSAGNIRAAVTSFIGREAELAEVRSTLRTHRLVTLTGVGGVGKTRLAVEAANTLVGEFPDGSWIFELAAVTDPKAVPDAVAAILGITQQPGRTLAESLAETLEGRVRLLVFDNCEHVLDAAAELIETILAGSSTVRILATSREGLGLVEEQLWPVPSLDVAGSESTAVALFVERAYSVAPQATLATTDTSPVVAEICRRLDGIPLAIELAASRMASMTVSGVRDRLDRRFRLLVGSRRGLERHQTLRHAVAWSYDLLDDQEKALLDRCSVFAGGFDLESACAVSGSDGADDFAVLDLLDALVRKSLLTVNRSSERTRYSMLETIRQFAEEQLATRGEATDARAAHAAYFAGRDADVLALWDSPRQREAYDWIAVELANLRNAFRWSADLGDLDVASAIVSYAAFLSATVANLEPIAWAEELVVPAAKANHAGLAAVAAVASMCWMTGRIEEAVGYSEQAMAAIEGSDAALPFGMDNLLGGALVMGGDPDRAIEWYRILLARREDRLLLSRLGIVLALVIAGHGAEAVSATDGLVDLAEATVNPYVLSFALFACGYATSDGDPVASLQGYRRGLVIARETGNRANESHLLASVSRLEAINGDPPAALDHLTLAIRSYHDYGNTANMKNVLASLVGLLDRIGRHEPAATIAGFAVNPFVIATYPEVATRVAHLREMLSDSRYEELTQIGKAMTTAEVATYAYEQIDHARDAVSFHG